MNGRSSVPRFACDPHRGLRAGHRWHVGGHNDPPVLPYAEILYGVPAANRQFGLRAGVRMLGYGPHLVLTFSFTSD